MSIKVLNKPILALLVGKDRFEHTHLGVKSGGAMDEYAYGIANKLLDNQPHTPMIELNFPHFTFEAQSNISIAITGAQCKCSINQTAIPMWQTACVKTGDIVNIGKITSGLRVYISVKNGFDIEQHLTRFTELRLKHQDILKLNNPATTTTKRLKSSQIPKYQNNLTLRFILSYQSDDFDKIQKQKFFDNDFVISNEISRMGYKLKGQAVSPRHSGVVSQGICFGAVQIPNDGQPIVLLKDRQTIGGYPIMGVVLDVDCFRLSQAAPQTKIRFTQISFEQGAKISKTFYKFLYI
jgi:biotin-dependent carboxylase-like uncharacterized protein